uniref:Uncharacterized protein n=1 Tax=Anguilla anguilla TaxID=7936 RepID=A0A0E9SCF5_ANGAN
MSAFTRKMHGKKTRFKCQ